MIMIDLMHLDIVLIGYDCLELLSKMKKADSVLLEEV